MPNFAHPLSRNSLPNDFLAVFGIGSPHGDDRIGWAVIQALADQVGSNVRLREIAIPIQILDNLDGVARLVLVDGCQSGLPAGTIVSFSWPSAMFSCSLAATTHGLGLAEVLALAQALGRLPREVKLIAMEIGKVEPGDGFSVSVQKALPELVDAVVQEMAAAHA